MYPMPPTLAVRCSRAQLFQQHCRARQRLTCIKTPYSSSATSISARQSSSSSSPSNETDPSTILSQPTWSIKSLLPDTSTSAPMTAAAASDSPISRTQLHHLLRLSALPPPSSPAEETSMLQTLSSQIHFVKQIQQVDTTNVSPLRSIRDETDKARAENTIDVSRLKDSLKREEFVGRNRRIQRKRGEKLTCPDGDSWTEKDALLKAGGKMMGRYFVVKSSEAVAE